jgi:NTE family protein
MNSPSRYFLAVLLLTVMTASAYAQSSARRPGIGLTLSGGGAKGLAHIGILKAIDSAGLKINYITGTSMGSILGALYAVGYSADSIEKISRRIDWDLLLSNQSTMRSMIMEEKDEYSKYYDIELPWVNHWFRFATGVIEGQELWLKFAELFRPVYNIKDFHKFSIPFECVATDVSTGEALTLDSGEIVSAIRSSMAIPSLFTAVGYNGRKLVDGGVVRNFPVKNVRDMGADLVIGSNVSGALRTSEQVTNAIQVLLQVAFFREAEDTRKQIPLCNIYVHQPLEKFGMASFGEANAILDAGVEEGRRLYPVFKHLADSLNAIYGTQDIVKKRLPPEVPVKISSFEVKGLESTSEPFFIQSMGLEVNQYYSAQNLSRMVRRAFGTRYYNRITYSLEPRGDSSRIAFEVTENPLTFAKIGLNYNQFSGISAIINLTSRDFFTPTSRSLVTLNIGQNFRMRAEHLQYFSRGGKYAFILGTQFDQFRITSYNSGFKEAGLYDQNYFKLDGKFSYSTNRDLSFGLGSRFEWIHYDPSITSSLEFKGRNDFMTGYFFIRHNTLDRPVYPRRGTKIEAEADYVFEQGPHAQYFASNTTRNDTSFSDKPYQRILFYLDRYSPLARRYTFLTHVQAGMNFNYVHNIMNEFSIGGLTGNFHNQVTFAGLREGTFYSSSLAELMVGLRYQLFSNTFITGKANVLFNNFISDNKTFFTTPDFLSGYALTFTYNFALGPLELSAMYCDQSKRVLGYVNIGIPF